MYDVPQLETLDEAECRRLLASVAVGRIVFTDRALPAIMPVNFAVYDGAVIIRTAAGSRLTAAARDAVVAFQADDIDVDWRGGWSVSLVGHARHVTDPADLAVLSVLPVRSWAPGDDDQVIRITIELIDGRRIGGGDAYSGCAVGTGFRTAGSGPVVLPAPPATPYGRDQKGT